MEQMRSTEIITLRYGVLYINIVLIRREDTKTYNSQNLAP